MKKIFYKVLAATLALSMLPCVTYAEDVSFDGYVVYVAPNGDDNAAGTEYAPLQTLQGAKEKVRALKAVNGYPEDGITVVFREGEYRVDVKTVFSEEDSGTADSPVVYRSYPGEEVTFTGGIKITKFDAVNTSAMEASDLVSYNAISKKANIRQVNLKGLLADAGYINYDNENKLLSFDNEPAMWTARYPDKKLNADTNTLHSQYLKTYTNDKWYQGTRVDGLTEDQFKYVKTDEGNDRKNNTDTEIAKIEEIFEKNSNPQVFGALDEVFWTNTANASIDAANDIIELSSVTGTGSNDFTVKHRRDFFILNVLSELNQQGEYWANDSTGMLYIYRDNWENAVLNVAASELDYMVETDGASYINFEGLNFENTRKSVFYIHGGENVLLKNCDIFNIGEHAARIGDYSGRIYLGGRSSSKYADDQYQHNRELYNQYTAPEYSKESLGTGHGIDSCRIMNTGKASVIMTGGNFFQGFESGYFVRNSEILYPGAIERSYNGAICFENIYGVDIVNNTLAHSPGAILHGNIFAANIQYNDIYDGMSESNDNALLYFSYQNPVMEAVISNNYFHDVPTDLTDVYGEDYKTGAWPQPQRGAIAFDNGSLAGGRIVENNIFENLPYGYWYTESSQINDNIFVDVFVPIKGGSPVNDYNAVSIDEQPCQNTVWNQRYLDNGNSIRGGKNPESYQWDIENYYSLLSLPIFAGGLDATKGTDAEFNEVERAFRADWTEKHPNFMSFVNMIEKNISGNKGFITVTGNLIVNTKTRKNNQGDEVTDISTYFYYPEMSDNEILGDYKFKASYIHTDENYKLEDNTSTTTSGLLTDYDGGDYSLKTTGGPLGNTLKLSSVGADASKVGVAGYDEALPQESFEFAATEYDVTNVVYISGQDDLLLRDELVSMKLLNADGEYVHVNQTKTAADGTYNFKFKVHESLEGSLLTVWAGGRVLNNNIFTTSSVNDVMTPEFKVTNSNNTIEMSMRVENNYYINDYDYTFILAGYDNSGKLINTKAVKAGRANIDGVTEDSTKVELSAVFESDALSSVKTVKGYLWNSLSGMLPLADVQIMTINNQGGN